LSASLNVGPIGQTDVEPAVRIFLDAFHDNVRRIYGDPPKPDAMVDMWSFAREIEPGGFLGARDDSKLVGYALFTSSVSRLQRRALLSGRIFAWALRALSGRYGILWGNLASQLWNKILFVGGSKDHRTSGDAQLLNIAVAPEARGRGVAKALMRGGMDYLAGRGVEEVRLEVEPENTPAIAVYREAGCVERGRMRNMYGEWLVMTGHPGGLTL
jgi:[ribosomal protein S18]-alanine N-acetyltransferase